MSEIINKIEGTVLSDKALDKVDVIREQAEEIGQLKGELEVASQEIFYIKKETDRQLEEAQKAVTVIIENEGNFNSLTNSKPQAIRTSTFHDPFGEMLSKLTNSIGKVKVTTKNIDDLPALADAIVKSDADKAVTAANKKADSAEKAKTAAEKDLKFYRDEESKVIDKAIDRAERGNIKRIDTLELEVKASAATTEALKREHDVFIDERDLAIEVMQHEVDVLKQRLTLKSLDPKTIIEKITNRMTSWFYSKKINTYLS